MFTLPAWHNANNSQLVVRRDDHVGDDDDHNQHTGNISTIFLAGKRNTYLLLDAGVRAMVEERGRGEERSGGGRWWWWWCGHRGGHCWWLQGAGRRQRVASQEGAE